MPAERWQLFRNGLDRMAAELDVRIAPHAGPRGELRALFELAEDSPTQLDSYLDRGRVLVAMEGEDVVGHVQVVDTGRAGEREITNVAIRPSHQGAGSAAPWSRRSSTWSRAESCATCSWPPRPPTSTTCFYQRLGFRMTSIEHDAFTVATGYSPETPIDGIELRDRVWLALAL